MTLIDLAKYSVMQSITRSLCDSWASRVFYFELIFCSLCRSLDNLNDQLIDELTAYYKDKVSMMLVYTVMPYIVCNYLCTYIVWGSVIHNLVHEILKGNAFSDLDLLLLMLITILIINKIWIIGLNNSLLCCRWAICISNKVS